MLVELASLVQLLFRYAKIKYKYFHTSAIIGILAMKVSGAMTK